MVLEFTINGQTVYYQTPEWHPVLQTGAELPHNAKGEDYPELLVDATIVASIQKAAEEASDEGVRQALRDGVHAGIQALQKRAGNGVRIYERTPKAA